MSNQSAYRETDRPFKETSAMFC